MTIITWFDPNSMLSDYLFPFKNRNKDSYECIIIGFGPSKLDVSFYNLSIVLGKNIYKIPTIEFAIYNILLCDLKLVVS